MQLRPQTAMEIATTYIPKVCRGIKVEQIHGFRPCTKHTKILDDLGNKQSNSSLAVSSSHAVETFREYKVNR